MEVFGEEVKTYPTISGLTPKLRTELYGKTVYLFRKEDGSNLRAEWNPKSGFYKFGRRNGLLDDSNPVLKEGPELFMAKYGEAFDRHLKKTGKIENATVYFEFFGPNSMFGSHIDEEHTVQVFDINIYKRGFLIPVEFRRFMDLAGDFDDGFVKLVEFKPNIQDILNTIYDGSMPGISFEGVVGKDAAGKHSFKFKCQRWYDALKKRCGDNQDLYNILK